MFIDLECVMKEFLVKQGDKWTFQLLDSDIGENSYRVAVPSGATHYSEGRYSGNGTFLKVDGINQYEYYNNVWLLRRNPLNEMYFTTRLLWQRNTATPNTSTQEKLKFIEKWLNGEKIQYILGVESDKIQSEKTQWHNFTEGAMQYVKRSDIKFREAPKYVTINGIEFKSVESLLKHVKNNFDLEDGE